MIVFWILVSLMAGLALAFVVPRLLRGARAPALSATAREARGKLRSLDAAYADGHLAQDEYQRRRQQIAALLLETVDDRPAGGSRAPVTAYLLLTLTPLAAIALYLVVGDPRAIVAAGSRAAAAAPATATASAAGDQAPELSEAITQLAARLAQNPDDVNGWFLLGRSYMAVQRFEDARGAFARALELAPGEPALMVEYAESIAFASGAPRLPQEAEALLREALEKQGDLQKALWLLGVGAYQRQDFQGALDYWGRLQALVEPGSTVAEQVAGQIAEARAALGPVSEPPAALARQAAEPARESTETPPALVRQAADPAREPTETPPAQGGDPALTVEVSLSEELRSRVDPGDTLFVFARAVSGPRMPLAIQRLPADKLPASVRLDASMAMTPSMSLATFAEVIVGARISKSGNASPQPGDLEALSQPVSSRSTEPVRLRIDKVL